ncbi:MAG TPA: choloylglycine hydrolase family protein [Desulfomonilia bacterium]
MKKTMIIIACFCFLTVLLPGSSYSCGSFRVTADDGSIIAARSMEFSVDLKYDIIVVPKDIAFESPAPDGKKGLKWKTMLGYVGVAAFGMDHGTSDGMNEKGLAMSLLWYENDMKWQSVGPRETSMALAQTYLTDWVLGNFSTVDEVKKNIQNVRVFSYVDTDIKMSLPSHFIIYDAFGGSIVIEYDNGVCNVYDNPLGIMTNAPNFPWQMTNLRQYIGMKTENPSSPMIQGKSVPPTGHGAGMIGLPGDYTPPSRFVRFYVLTRYADRQPDAKGNLNLAQHIINTFDIPQGIITDIQPDGKTVLKELTQWVTFKDLTNRNFYFRTYDNFNLRKVDLKALDFNAKTIKRISMFGSPEAITDVTGQAR